MQRWSVEALNVMMNSEPPPGHVTSVLTIQRIHVALASDFTLPPLGMLLSVVSGHGLCS
jgi:hypothetical protein